MKPVPRFVQLVSDPKLGLLGLAADGLVWCWCPQFSDAGGRAIYARWEELA